MRPKLSSVAWFGAGLLAWMLAVSPFCPAQPVAFPGAVGQGAVATGGRGGDVYHVTNLLDYTSSEPAVQGSLRYGIASAAGPRTIVFDVGGALPLARPLNINRDNLTLAGQTSPTGVTVWGYPTSVSGAEDVVVRFMRFRTGDFNIMTANPDGTPTDPIGGNGNMDLLGDNADAISIYGGSDRVIFDHLSASWSVDETMSVTVAKNVTVQNSIIAASLNDSLHYKGEHGYGSLVRGEVTPEEQTAGTGGYTFYENLWAHHKARNPSIGGQQNLEPGQLESDRRRADVNFVNNVVYDWGSNPTHRNQDGEIRVNFVGNYHIKGPSSSTSAVFQDSGSLNGDTHIYQSGNYRDIDLDAVHDGTLIATQSQINSAFTGFEPLDTINAAGTGVPFNFYSSVEDWVVSADTAYEHVMNWSGASLWRDEIDDRALTDVDERTGGIINSQEIYRVGGVLPGIDDLSSEMRPAGFDSDGDGMPDRFELENGLDPGNAADRNATDLSYAGYTNLEVYLNSLVVDTISPRVLAGDYNENGVVDAADYTTWRDSLGTPVAKFSAADGDGSGIIDPSDFIIWRQRFGRSALLGAGAGTGTVPEPASLALLLVGGIVFCCRRFRCGARATMAD